MVKNLKQLEQEIRQKHAERRERKRRGDYICDPEYIILTWEIGHLLFQAWKILPKGQLSGWARGLGIESPAYRDYLRLRREIPNREDLISWIRRSGGDMRILLLKARAQNEKR